MNRREANDNGRVVPKELRVTYRRWIAIGLCGARSALVLLIASFWPLSQSVAAPDQPPPISRLNEIAPRIAACVHLPREDDEITVRLSFNRSGALIGRPRIMFMKSSGGPDGEAALANALLAAMHDCTPLPFTESLGAAIAGNVMTIHFVGHKGKSQAPERWL